MWSLPVKGFFFNTTQKKKNNHFGKSDFCAQHRQTHTWITPLKHQSDRTLGVSAVGADTHSQFYEQHSVARCHTRCVKVSSLSFYFWACKSAFLSTHVHTPVPVNCKKDRILLRFKLFAVVFCFFLPPPPPPVSVSHDQNYIITNIMSAWLCLTSWPQATQFRRRAHVHSTHGSSAD